MQSFSVLSQRVYLHAFRGAWDDSRVLNFTFQSQTVKASNEVSTSEHV